MRVLYVSKFFPLEPATQVYGVHKRIDMFVDALRPLAQLDLLFYVPPDADASAAECSRLQEVLAAHWDADVRLSLCREAPPPPPSRWRSYGAGALSVFAQAGLGGTSGPEQVRALEACLERRPDAVLAHMLSGACPVLRTRRPLPPVFFDLQDIDHTTFAREIRQPPRWPGKRLLYLQLPARIWGEQRAIRRATRTFVSSETDRRYLASSWRSPRVVTIPNSISVPARVHAVPPEPRLLLLGAYAYPPNAQAADFLLERVWPGIRAAVPDARLTIAGPGPERIRAFGAGAPGVEFVGFAPEVEALYRSARVVCAPILTGGGTRLKILEAAAFAKPVVSTRIGAEGLDMRDGRELLLRDDPEGFAAACVQLLQDDLACERLGTAARAAVIHRFAREEVVRAIREQVRQALTPSPRRAGAPAGSPRPSAGPANLITE